MGTPNFASPSNASKYFVVLANQEVETKKCNDCDEVHIDWEYTLEDLKECQQCGSKDLTEETITHSPESYEFDDFIENIGYEIKALGGIKENESFNDRNYERQSLGYLYDSKVYGDVKVEVKITAIIQSAYYEGATLDYIIQLESNGETFNLSTGNYYDEDTDSVLENIFDPYHTDLNAGLCKIMRVHAENWVEQTITDLSEKLEKLYEDWSEHKLNCKGVFSNGEAVYEKV